MAAWTQADVDALQTAVKSGVLTVSYDGPPRRSITYRSLKEMLAILATAQQSLNAQTGKPNYTVAGTRKGVEPGPNGGLTSPSWWDDWGWP